MSSDERELTTGGQPRGGERESHAGLTLVVRYLGRVFLVTGIGGWIASYLLLKYGGWLADPATVCGRWTLVALIGAAMLVARRIASSPSLGANLRAITISGLFKSTTERIHYAGIFRQPISGLMSFTLGLACVVTLLIGYTLISRQRHAENPHEKVFPTWVQLYHQGLVKSFTERSDDSGNAKSSTDAQTVPNLRGNWFARFPRSLMEPFLTDRYDVWIWADSKATFGRLFGGLFTGTLVSVILGLMMGCYPPVEAFFRPTFWYLAKIPPTAALGIFFVLFGTEIEFYVMVVAFCVVPTLTQAICSSAKEDVPEELISKAYTLGASQLTCIWDVVYKQVLPRVLECIRLQIGIAMICLIAAEMVNGSDGFGHRLRLMAWVSNYNVIYVYLAYLGMVGALFDAALIGLRRSLCPWCSR
jgi:NitT/TauT family transport system permease protein